MLDTLRALGDRYYMPVYERHPIAIDRAEGMRVWDTAGREYVDFFCGFGVNNVGHCHPAVVEAIREQAGKLIHAGGIYHTEPAMRLSERLVECSLGGRVFLSNSGAEANECAIKLARKVANARRGEDPRTREIVVVEGAFHGRTLGTLSATPQPAKQKLFEPMVEGFVVVPRNDVGALEAAIGAHTAAVLLEPVQGEGGVYPLSPEFIAAARAGCDAHGSLLIFDEVQAGMGRTGTLWAYEQTGVVPDVLTVAKALAGGLPIGATVTSPAFGSVFAPSEHGSTFGGNPVACAAALAVMDVVRDPELLREVRKTGEWLLRELEMLVASGKARAARGRGFMAAIDLPTDSARDVVFRALDAGFLINSTGPRTVRFLPPLIAGRADLERLLSFLDAALGPR